MKKTLIICGLLAISTAAMAFGGGDAGPAPSTVNSSPAAARAFASDYGIAAAKAPQTEEDWEAYEAAAAEQFASGDDER